MASRVARQTNDDNEKPAIETVAETITYLPGEGDPVTVTWCGHTFRANVPKEVTGHPDGTSHEQLNHHLIERARDNPQFKVGNAPRKRTGREMPVTAEGYRAYMVNWLQDPALQHADQLIERFAKDRDLQAACEVGADDYSYLATLFMPKLHDMAKADELTEGQVAQLWLNRGFTQLPW